MNFIKRAWLNVTRKKGRTLLLILIMSAILLFVFAGLIIQEAASKAVDNAKQSANATVTLSANRDNAFKQLRKNKKQQKTLSFSSVSLKTVRKIARSKYVKNYNVLNSTTGTAKSFKAIKTSSSGTSQLAGPMGNNGQKKTNKSSTNNTSSLSLSGVTSTALTSAFSEGTNKIISGRGLTVNDQGTNHAVIEKQLAKQNDLTTGETIKVKVSGKIVKLKIVGIYRANSSSTSQMQPQMNDPSNTIYLSSRYVGKLKGKVNQADSVTFTMTNPAKATTFITQAKKQINTTKFSLTTNDSVYQTMLTPLNNIKSFSQKIIWLVCIAGTAILTLLVILMVRERRYEAGVLLSLGEKKGKIILQFFTELLLVMIVSSVIALIGGKYAGNLMSKQLIQQTTTTQVTSMGDQAGGGMQGGGMQGAGNAKMPSGQTAKMTGKQQTRSFNQQNQTSSLKLKISLKTVLELLGFGLLIIFISVILGTINILRLPPKKILTM